MNKFRISEKKAIGLGMTSGAIMESAMESIRNSEVNAENEYDYSQLQEAIETIVDGMDTELFLKPDLESHRWFIVRFDGHNDVIIYTAKDIANSVYDVIDIDNNEFDVWLIDNVLVFSDDYKRYYKMHLDDETAVHDEDTDLRGFIVAQFETQDADSLI